MSNTKKILLGILTFSPLIFLILYLFTVFSMMTEIIDVEQTGNVKDPDEMMKMMVPMFIYMGIMIFLSITLLIIYLLDIFSWNKKIANQGNTKLVWTLIVLFTSGIGMIVYFFAEIVPRKELPPLPHNNNNEMV